jgi:hypothetical protein
LEKRQRKGWLCGASSLSWLVRREVKWEIGVVKLAFDVGL